MGEGVPDVNGLHRLLAATALAVVAAALGVAAFADTDSRTDGGPLRAPNPHGWSTSNSVGDVFTDGMEVLHLEGNREAVIEDVRLVGDDGLELVGAKVAGQDRAIGFIQYNADFPPVNDPDLGDPVLIDAIGATVTPYSGGWELLLGIKATKEGFLVREGVEIDYRVGGEEYTVFREAWLGVCTSPRYEVDGDCPLPGGE